MQDLVALRTLEVDPALLYLYPDVQLEAVEAGGVRAVAQGGELVRPELGQAERALPVPAGRPTRLPARGGERAAPRPTHAVPLCPAPRLLRLPPPASVHPPARPPRPAPERRRQQRVGVEQTA